jgi:septum formation protein
VANDRRSDPTLILASASPRRRELLARFGLAFVVRPAAIDESPRGDERPRDYVTRMAIEKARAAAGQDPGWSVLAADTSVVLDDRILGKPADPSEARCMLASLSDRAHQVMTAVCLISPDRSGQAEASHRLSCTEVWFARLCPAWIDAYVASGDPMDKAGGYGIQNAAGLKVRRIDGSYSGVVGLPLHETGQLLEAAGLLAPGWIAPPRPPVG